MSIGVSERLSSNEHTSGVKQRTRGLGPQAQLESLGVGQLAMERSCEDGETKTKSNDN